MSRLVFGQSCVHPSQDFWDFFWLKNPANSETVKVFRAQKTRTFAPKIFFARALNHRQPRYRAMARRGVTVLAEEVAQILSPADFDRLIARAIDRKED